MLAKLPPKKVGQDDLKCQPKVRVINIIFFCFSHISPTGHPAQSVYAVNMTLTSKRPYLYFLQVVAAWCSIKLDFSVDMEKASLNSDTPLWSEWDLSCLIIRVVLKHSNKMTSMVVPMHIAIMPVTRKYWDNEIVFCKNWPNMKGSVGSVGKNLRIHRHADTRT